MKVGEGLNGFCVLKMMFNIRKKELYGRVAVPTVTYEGWMNDLR